MDELHIADEAALPLDNLDENFRAVDALITYTPDGGAIQTPWPPADVIIGNPPFLGAKRLKPERGVDYVNSVRRLYKEIPGMADYCVYWIRRSHDHLPKCTEDDRFKGRAGLVGTQNIRTNQSRIGGLDYVVESGTIVEAVENQRWSGEAAVSVSIANWVKHGAVGSNVRPPLPKNRTLWKSFGDELVARSCSTISSALSDEFDVSQAAEIASNREPKRVFQGITPGHAGFVLSARERQEIVDADQGASENVIHPYLVGRELVTGDGTPERFVIDFQRRDAITIQAFPAAYRRVKKLVLPDRERKAEQGRGQDGEMRPHHRQFLARWWRLSWDRADMFEAFKTLRCRYIACSRATLRPIFAFVSSQVWPGDKLQLFAFDDDYSFAVLQAAPHWAWFVAKCSLLGGDTPSYSPDSVFDTFPWPQSPTKQQVDAVAAAGREVRRVRTEALKVTTGGLRAVYRTLELPGRHPLKDAHAGLDAAVLAAYGFDSKKDLLAQLLELNLTVAAREKQGLPVNAPGVPPAYGDASSLITDDCIRP